MWTNDYNTVIISRGEGAQGPRQGFKKRVDIPVVLWVVHLEEGAGSYEEEGMECTEAWDTWQERSLVGSHPA